MSGERASFFGEKKNSHFPNICKSQQNVSLIVQSEVNTEDGN